MHLKNTALCKKKNYRVSSIAPFHLHQLKQQIILQGHIQTTRYMLNLLKQLPGAEVEKGNVFVMLPSMWDLSAPTRQRTCAFYSGSTKKCQGSPGDGD